ALEEEDAGAVVEFEAAVATDGDELGLAGRRAEGGDLIREVFADDVETLDEVGDGGGFDGVALARVDLPVFSGVGRAERGLVDHDLDVDLPVGVAEAGGELVGLADRELEAPGRELEERGDLFRRDD